MAGSLPARSGPGRRPPPRPGPGRTPRAPGRPPRDAAAGRSTSGTRARARRSRRCSRRDQARSPAHRPQPVSTTELSQTPEDVAGAATATTDHGHGRRTARPIARSGHHGQPSGSSSSALGAAGAVEGVGALHGGPGAVTAVGVDHRFQAAPAAAALHTGRAPVGARRRRRCRTRRRSPGRRSRRRGGGAARGRGGRRPGSPQGS